MDMLNYVVGHACYPVAVCLYWLLADNLRCAIADIAFMSGLVVFACVALWRA